MELEVIIYGVVIIFISIIVVTIGFTIFGLIMPELQEFANESSLINATSYEEDQTQIYNFAKIALFICIAVPFVYIAIRLLYKKEPTAYIGDDY